MFITFYQWMINSDNSKLFNFKLGYMTGVIVVLLLLIVIKLVHYFMFQRHKKVQEIQIPAEGGAIFVTSGALIDLVKIVAAGFDYVEIVKVAIWETKLGITMKIYIKYDIYGKRYPELAQDMKKEIQENLEGRLGVSCIRYIEVHSRKTTDIKNSGVK